MSNILIAEDSIPKYDDICNYINNMDIEHTIFHATTYLECVEKLKFNNDEIDILILDMTLPRFVGEVPYKFAGYDILQRMYYENLDIPTFVLTGYSTFTTSGEITDIDELIDRIEKSKTIHNTKVVSYSVGNERWAEELKKFIRKGI